MAVIGISSVIGILLLTSAPQLRAQALNHVVEWAQPHRAVANVDTVVTAPSTPEITPLAYTADNTLDSLEAPRFMATAVESLSRRQADVAAWISKKYRVAPEAIGLLVQAAWKTGQAEHIDPALILAIMAIESSFNPFAQSAVGAQGLMQVMTHIHSEKYEEAGGTLAALDPVTNMRVGVQVLKETIQRSGSLRNGLKYYSGAANLPDDRGYGDKVLAEYARIRAVADGHTVAHDAKLPVRLPNVSSPTSAQVVRVSLEASRTP